MQMKMKKKKKGSTYAACSHHKFMAHTRERWRVFNLLTHTYTHKNTQFHVKNEK